MRLSFDEANVAGARALLRILRREIDTLAFAQQLEHRAADGAAVEKMFNPAFVADEPEPFVDEEPCDRPSWHSQKPSRSEGRPASVELENGASLGKFCRGSQGESGL